MAPRPLTKADRKGDLDWKDALEQMAQWIVLGEAFCYTRFVDGELNAIMGKKGGNCDGHKYFADMGDELRKVLFEIAGRHPNHGNLLVGGAGWIDPGRWSYILRGDLLRRVPWVHAQAFVAGIESMATMRCLEALRDCNRPRLLVCNEKVKGAAKFLKAEWVPVPERNCWLQGDRVMENLRHAMLDGAIVVHCAGMACKVWAWRLWNERPDTSHIDMGHFFDGAFGIQSRQWLLDKASRWVTYAKSYAPLIRAEVKPCQ